MGFENFNSCQCLFLRRYPKNVASNNYNKKKSIPNLAFSWQEETLCKILLLRIEIMIKQRNHMNIKCIIFCKPIMKLLIRFSSLFYPGTFSQFVPIMYISTILLVSYNLFDGNNYLQILFHLFPQCFFFYKELMSYFETIAFNH